MEKKVEVSDLEEGMYVSRLDRPWLDTPFLMEGLLVDNIEDLKQLKQICEYVYIDTDKSTVEIDTKPRSKVKTRSGTSEKNLEKMVLQASGEKYPEMTTVEEELPLAKELNNQISTAVQEIMDDARQGNKISIDSAKGAVTKMKESILRNPSAFMLVSLVKDKDSYIYAHCMNVSALCIVFGRHLGLPSETLDELAIGALLCDIGKTRVTSELINKPGKLTAEEFEEVKKHVEYSLAIMDESGQMSSAAIEIVKTHHERYNGNGYRNGLKGGQIPVLGRMTAIVDSYDAMTSERLYDQAMSPYEAIRKLFGERDQLFQESLIEHFIQAIGIYPVGTIVELSTGEAGIVISQNQVRRLRPKVMLVLDKNKQSLAAGPILDLMTETTDSNDVALEIINTLEPGTYGIDPKEFFI